METISINLIPGGILPSIHVSQNDVGRQFRLNLLEGSVGHILDGTEDVTIEIGKPDNHIVTAEVTNTSSNYVVIETTDQMTACPGKCLCEIRIAKDGVDIGTANFNLIVECSPIAGGIESGSVIHDIERVVADLVEEDVPEFVTPYLLTANANGNPAIFTDGAKDVPVGELVTAITAKQDLHGYSKPWPAGGGKNKINDSLKYQASDVMCYVGGTTNGYVVSLSAGTYTISVDFNGEPYAMYMREENDTDNTALWNSGAQALTQATFTVTGGKYRFWAYRGTSGGGVDANNIKSVQIEEGSSATSYEPYSNVCPISGYSQAKILLSGKNLFRFGDQSGERRTDIINLDTPLPAGDYTISAVVTSTDTDSATSMVEFRYEDNTTQYVQLSRNTRSSYVRTLTKTVIGIRFYASNNNANSAGDTFSFKDIQLESGSTATDYEPFSGSINTLDFGQTVYGGSLNVTTGVLTIDKKHVLLDGTESNSTYAFASGTGVNRIAYNPYQSEGKVGSVIFASNIFKNSGVRQSFPPLWEIGNSSATVARCFMGVPTSITSVADWKTFLTQQNVEICYELEEPIVIQLTPTEISTLYGLNIISSNCGEVAVEYRADVGLYISNLPKELPEVTAADNGKLLGVSGGVWTKVNGGGGGGSDLPVVGPTDAGKVLTVDSTGNWVADEVPEELPAVTSSDNGKVLGVSGGAWTKVAAPSGLPAATSADEGKLLGVDSNGNWGKTNPFAEETWTFTLSDNTTVTKTLLIKVVSE